jgi:hypothetical protein
MPHVEQEQATHRICYVKRYTLNKTAEDERSWYSILF